MEKVYIVTCVTEEEYGMSENVAVFANEADAKAYVAERQEQWHHWNGKNYNRYAIEEWLVN